MLLIYRNSGANPGFGRGEPILVGPMLPTSYSRVIRVKQAFKGMGSGARLSALVASGVFTAKYAFPSFPGDFYFLPDLHCRTLTSLNVHFQENENMLSQHSIKWTKPGMELNLDSSCYPLD